MHIIIQTHLCVTTYFQQCYSMILLQWFLFKTHWMCLFTWSIELVSMDLHSLQWHHNGHDGISNHQPHHCLLNRLFGHRSKETSKLCVTGLCAGNSLGTGEFPAQMAGNAENVSIWWRHHGTRWTIPTKDNLLCSWLSFCVWYHGLTTFILNVGSFWSLKQMVSEFEIKDNKFLFH